ncbi:pirin family protein [Solemya velesiana gill symbiont]|uniref:Quercetin 2,3-dioxygenase n=1 Tax=Solemya velesiana gill symbiont TaxID=1918948 RepID=A0A1T2KX84_9GAMM|nr:pirin family protein [Solemya velesiana gill symbiont]OOZ37336.1 quercetin 2,3-dioxygenase [Solemya velesiana gill symbiont]
MITLRRSEERGHANHGWLDAYHSFSFGQYYDPEHMGVSALRVINQDRIAPSKGFPPHDHQDMEIVTYIHDGALEHRDSMGNQGVIRPGEVQRMSAGSGVTHSEYNHSSEETTHLLQIWIQPDTLGIAPGYEQTRFDENEKRGKLRLIASPDGREGSVTIQQDASIYSTLLDGNEDIHYEPGTGRNLYLHLAMGSMQLNGETLQSGDGAQITDEPILVANRGAGAEFLLFDLP